ncbi:hypothetical protein [Streptomyces sp. NPDC091209]|uniref:hypothetical protein n=1 Tax=Streptomyces sp. NPDC091209 TaxID=3365974 RepID=UPI0037F15314
MTTTPPSDGPVAVQLLAIINDFFPELRRTALDEVLGILGARAPHLIPEGMREG